MLLMTGSECSCSYFDSHLSLISVTLLTCFGPVSVMLSQIPAAGFLAMVGTSNFCYWLAAAFEIPLTEVNLYSQVGLQKPAVDLQSEEEGLKVKQEETSEAVQQQAEAGEPTAAALVVPVQNGEGDSLNLSAGFIQVLFYCAGYSQ